MLLHLGLRLEQPQIDIVLAHHQTGVTEHGHAAAVFDEDGLGQIAEGPRRQGVALDALHSLLPRIGLGRGLLHGLAHLVEIATRDDGTLLRIDDFHARLQMLWHAHRWPVAVLHLDAIAAREMQSECGEEVGPTGIELGSDLLGTLLDGHELTAELLGQGAQENLDQLLAYAGHHPLDLTRGEMFGHGGGHLHGDAIALFAWIISIAQWQHGGAKGDLIGEGVEIDGELGIADKVLLGGAEEVGLLLHALVHQLVEVVDGGHALDALLIEAIQGLDHVPGARAADSR